MKVNCISNEDRGHWLDACMKREIETRARLDASSRGVLENARVRNTVEQVEKDHQEGVAPITRAMAAAAPSAEHRCGTAAGPGVVSGCVQARPVRRDGVPDNELPGPTIPLPEEHPAMAAVPRGGVVS